MRVGRYSQQHGRSRPDDPEEYDVDEELLYRVARAQVRLEKNFSRVEGKTDAMGVDLEKVVATARKAGWVQAMAKWAIGLSFPLVTASAVTMIKGHQRLETLEQNLKLYNDRSGQMQYDISTIQSDIRVIAVELKHGEAQSKSLKQIAADLEELKKSQPTKRRRR